MHFPAGLSALSLFILPALSAPTMRGISRAEKVIDSLDKLLQLIDGVDPVYDAWDYENIDGACSVWMYTHAGANCEVTIRCKDYEHKFSGSDFNVCYLNGEQFFTDDAIGEFSVKWTGIESETLGAPELRVGSIDDGTAWDVRALAVEGENNKKSDAPPKICNAKPEDFEFDGPFGENKKGECIYECGVPRLGSAGPGGRNWLPEKGGFASGWCGMHVTQHQKPDPSKDQYKFDITLYDANEQQIGKLSDAKGGKTIDVTSTLPLVMLVDGGAVDEDPVWFHYGAQVWSSNDQEHHCDFGAYDNMKREGDCGFSC